MKSVAASCSLGVALLLSCVLFSTEGCKKDPNVQKQKYLESGQRYAKDGKYREAGIQFSNALKVDRNFAAAHYEMSKVYLQLSNPMAAYQELMRTVDLDPSNVKARADLGSLLVAGGVPDRALDQAKAILAQDGNSSDGYALRAQAEVKKGDRPAALSDIQHAISIEPGRSSFHTTLALLQGTSGQPLESDQAKAELEKAVSLDPANSTARIALAGLLVKSGDRAGAEQQLQTAIQQAPKSVPLRAALAGLFIQEKDEARAQQTLQAAAADLPDDESAVSLLKDYDLHSNKLPEARTAYAQLSHDHPRSVPIRIANAQILLQSGEIGSAKSIVDDLSKTDSKNPQVELLNGFLLMRAGKNEEAYALMQKSVRNSPENVPLQIMLGRTAAVKGDLNTSEAAFHAAAHLDPSNLEAQRGLATIASGRGDSSLLSQVADATINLHPDYPEAYLWRGTASADRKEYAHAEADFQTARKLDPNSVAAVTLLGRLYLSEGKTAEGRNMLEETLRKDPNSMQALTFLMRSDIAAKQPQAALSRVQDAIRRSPGNAQLYTTLAMLELGLKNYPDARDAAARAMSMDSSDENAVQAYSQAQAALGGTDQAIGVWEKWATAHPADPKAPLILGTLEEARGDFPKAITNYKRTLDLKPNDPLASNNLAYLMVESGQNIDVALTHAQTARHGLPDSPNTADTLAWVYYYKGSYAAARDLLEDAAKQAPDNASIQYHLGATYAKLGDKSNAAVHLQKATTLAPDSKAGKDASAAAAKLG